MVQNNDSNPNYILGIVLLASFVVPFMASSVNLAIPDMGVQFNCSAFMLSWVMNSYLLSSAAFLLPLGRLADLLGRREVYLFGLVVFFSASLLCSFAWSIETLILFRVIQGIGSSAMFGTGIAILTLAFPPESRGRILGYNSAVVYVGLSIGPFIGGIMNHYLGWHSIFFCCALLGLPVILLAFRKLYTETVDTGAARFDPIGAVMYSIGLWLLLYGLSAIANGVLPRFAAVIGLLLLILFIWRQMVVSDPIFDVRLLVSNTVFTFANLAALINYSATFAVGYVLSIYLQVVRGYDSQGAGLIMIVYPIFMAVLSPYAGALSDRIAPGLVAAWGMGLITFALVLCIFLTGSTSLWFICGALIILGVGFALFATPNNNAVMGSVARQHYGVAGSTLSTMRLVGQALSMVLATLIIDFHIGDTPLFMAEHSQLLSSFQSIFSLMAVACFCGIFVSLVGRKQLPRSE